MAVSSLPLGLLRSLEAEGAGKSPLHESLWAEGSAGSDVLLEAASGPGTTTALAVLALERIIDALASAEAELPLYLKKRRRSVFKASSSLSLKDLLFGGRSNSSSESGGGGGGGGEGAGGEPNTPKPHLHVLVLTKNRETAANVTDELRRLGKGVIPGLSVATLTGGVPVAENAKMLEGGCHIAVGTPGRVKFLTDKRILDAAPARLLVLESADWLLAPVFVEDVRFIVGKFPEEKQVVAHSTVPPSEAIEESLCGLLGVPSMKRVDPSGNIQESGLRMPAPLPSPCPAAAASPRSQAGCGGGSTAGSCIDDWADGAQGSPHRVATAAAGGAAASTLQGGQGRPAQQVLVAAATAKERLIFETMQAMSILSTAGGRSSSGGRNHQVRERSRARISTRFSLPSIRRSASSAAYAFDVAAAAAPVKEAVAGGCRAHGEKKGGFGRAVSFGGNARGAPPPAHTIVSKGMFAAAAAAATAKSVPTTAAPSSSGSGSTGFEEGRTSPGGSSSSSSSSSPTTSSSSSSSKRDVGDDCHRRGQTAGGSSNGGGVKGTAGALSRAGAMDDDAASTLGLLSPGAVAATTAAMVAAAGRVPRYMKQTARRRRAEGSSSSLVSPTSLASPAESPAANAAGSEDPLFGVGAAAAAAVSPRDDAGNNWQQQRQLAAPQRSGAFAPPRPSSSWSSCLSEEEWQIPPVLLASLEAEGVVSPTPLQESVWKSGRGSARADLIVHAHPGDEATITFCIPVLERVLERYPRSLVRPPSGAGSLSAVCAPLPAAAACSTAGQTYELVAMILTRTRDMASEISETLVRLGKDIPSLKVATLIGGVPVEENRQTLAGGCNVVVGTPRRVKLLMEEGVLRVTATSRTLILDSADWLMAPVFHADVGWIAGEFPKEKQVLAFSGADPKTYEAGLTAVVGSAGMTPLDACAAAAAAAVSMATTPPQSPAAVAAAPALEHGHGSGDRDEERGEGAGAGPAPAPGPDGAAAALAPLSNVSPPVERDRRIVQDGEASADPGAAALPADAATATAAAAVAAFPPPPLPVAAAPRAPAATCGDGDTRGRRSESQDAPKSAPVAAGATVSNVSEWSPSPASAACSSSATAGAGVCGRPPAAGRRASPIRTLGMIREESARRAQGLGTYWNHGVVAGGVGLVSAAATATAGSAAGAAATTNLAMGTPPLFLTDSVKGSGKAVGLGGVGLGVGVSGVGGGVCGGRGSSSTSSISMGSTNMRARARSSSENDMYGAWCA